jgi:hypothetical protein
MASATSREIPYALVRHIFDTPPAEEPSAAKAAATSSKKTPSVAKRHVLVLGAGYVSEPLIRYLARDKKNRTKIEGKWRGGAFLSDFT